MIQPNRLPGVESEASTSDGGRSHIRPDGLERGAQRLEVGVGGDGADAVLVDVPGAAEDAGRLRVDDDPDVEALAAVDARDEAQDDVLVRVAHDGPPIQAEGSARRSARCST